MERNGGVVGAMTTLPSISLPIMVAYIHRNIILFVTSARFPKVMKSKYIPMMEVTEEVERSIMPLSAIILVI